MRIMACLLVTWMIAVPPASAADWPGWLGPRRDSVWREQGIVEKFPEDGLKVRWRSEVALGYSGPAVADGKVYVMDYRKKAGKATNTPSNRDELQGRERVLCFDSASGERLWLHDYERPYKLSFPRGPRCTPTVDDGNVYTLGAEGSLRCLDAETGEAVWTKELTEAYDVKTPIWGFSAHPLVQGERLYCLVGGEGSLAVAFDKNTGEEIWRSLSAKNPGYCPPTIIEHAGVKQLLIWHPKAINSLNPQTGEVYWSLPLEPSYNMSIAVPRKSGSRLFASGIGHTGALMKLNDEKPDAEILWRGKTKTAVYSANSTPFLEDGMIYGNDCHLGALLGVRMKDGERLWRTFEPTTGKEGRSRHATVFLVKHQDRFFLFNDAGDLILADLSRDGYKEISRFHVLEPTNTAFGRDVVWSHPAFAEQCLFARNDEELVCVSLAADDY